MKPVLLCILDGVGMREETYGNAVKSAHMPVLQNLLNTCPNSLLRASEESVGLPKGQMGNSEVGHLTIGSGRVIYQPLERINKEIETGEFFQRQNFKKIIQHVQKNHSKLHIMGLLSDGGIHSHISYLMPLIESLKEEEIDIYYHCFLDGRDTPPNIALKYLNQLDQKIKEINKGTIGSISGRYYAMDRDNRWDRIEKAYQVIVKGEGNCNKSYHEVIEESYKEGVTDEFILPTLLEKNAIIEDNDGIFVFNYRPDRLRELFTAITNPEFNEFSTKTLTNIKLVTMMPVSDQVICENVYEDLKLEHTLGEYISDNGLSQLRIAETEKYAHVTYFFDGGEEKELKDCKRILIPSPKVATYDLKPEMSAIEITHTLLEEMDKDIHDVIILNFANGDMLGHTGNFNATVKSLETLDQCLEKIVAKIKEKNGSMIITADHGNSDTMLDENGNKVTSHSLSLVPFIVVNYPCRVKNGTLADIAPTMLKILDLDIPEEMTGKILLEEINR